MIGLPPFLESSEARLRGREADRDALLRMLSKQWVRAGLLVGEPGVGKSAFLRREIVPRLGEGEGVAILCRDALSPTACFAASAASAGFTARSGESDLDLLARAIETAPGAGQWTFIYDDLDLALTGSSASLVVHELAELLARLCPRPGGRVRFLFSSSDTRLHACDALERLVGPLFAVTCRHTLPRLSEPDAAEMLTDSLEAEGFAPDPAVSREVLRWLASGARGVLPAHVRMAARALRILGIRTVAELSAEGGPADLVRQWILSAAGQPEARTVAMRVLGELAVGGRHQALDVEQLARRSGVGPGLTGLAIQGGIQTGLCVRVPDESSYALAHEVLVQPVRDVTSPDLERAQRARRSLEAAAARRSRLSWREWTQVRRAKIAPVVPEEAVALRATTRLWLRAGLVALAVPVVVLLLVYSSQWGGYHVSLDGEGPGGRLWVRAGRPSVFDWLPQRPPFGTVIADPGTAEWMIRKPTGIPVELTGSLSDERDGRAAYVAMVLDLLRTPLRGALDYLLDTDGAPALVEIENTVEHPADWVEVLGLLAPLARGGKTEARLLSQALSDRRHDVRAAALEAIGDVEARRPGLFHEVLADAMVSEEDPKLARRVRTVVRAMPEDVRAAVAAAGVVRAKAAPVRAQLLADVGRLDRVEARLAARVGASLLGQGDPNHAERAWELLEHALAMDGEAGARGLIQVVGDDRVRDKERIRAVEMLGNGLPAGLAAEATGPVAAAAAAKSQTLRAAALPLLARIAPTAARPLLDGKGSTEIRAAQALAWGELLATDKAGATSAIEELLRDGSAHVRGSAARAYGRLGRQAQGRLVEMVKEMGPAGEGAAWGLAESVESGGSLDNALRGIGTLWSKKGGPKRDAARVYAHMAGTRPGPVRGYLMAAARDSKDARLRRIGVEGLCAAHKAGAGKEVESLLNAVASGSQSDSRELLSTCVAEQTKPAEVVIGVASRLHQDSDARIRRQMAGALGRVARDGVSGRPARDVVSYLSDLASDRDEFVRAEALQALVHPSLASVVKGNRTVRKGLKRAWERVENEEEKLTVLAAVQACGTVSIMEQAASDDSPRVRVRAIEGLAAMNGDIRLAVERGLADGDARVRQAAVRALSRPGRVEPNDAVELLEIALGDDAIAGEALVLYARMESPKRALGRLGAALSAPSERDRARAARAAATLIVRDVSGSRELLESALEDPARDVRLAALEALSEVEAQKKKPSELAKVLAESERDAMRRLLAARALLLVARSEKSRDGVRKALEPVAKGGPPFGRLTAEIVLALLRTDSDGPAFLSAFVP